MRFAQHLRSIGLLAFGAVLAAVAGVAYGAVNQGGQVHGCYVTTAPHQLQVIDPSVTPSCPSGTTALNWVQKAPSVYSTFHDATQSVGGSFTQVGALGLPAGSYLIIAKLSSFASEPGYTTFVKCQLSAGVDSDTDRASSGWDAGNSIASPNSSTEAPMALTVVHTFTSAGAATLACYGSSVGNHSVSNVKITAIKVGSISNLGF